MNKIIFSLLILLVCYCDESRGILKSKFIIHYQAKNPKYSYETKWFDSKIDHFGFAVNGTYKQRYLINDTWWTGGDGSPIFLYAGNEGDIEAFAQNTGFMWDIAPEFNALVIFIEHRYYGKSLPFGNSSIKPDPRYNGYLTSEQALADYAYFVDSFKKNTKGAEHSPVIVFGGSYGGMLAAWMRMKYPHIVDGAIAASAPIAQFDTPCEAFARIVTSDYKVQDRVCSDIIRKSWAALDALSKNADDLKWLQNELKLCSPLKNVTTLKQYLSDVWVNAAMMDYPYPTEFLSPLPGYPVKAICEALTRKSTVKTVPAKPKDLVALLSAGFGIYVNYTGGVKCVRLDEPDDLGAGMWEYQSCTEMVMPLCYDNVNDMFEKSEWNFTDYSEECVRTWKVNPDERMARIMYGERDLKAASNIVFSNGLLDPWSSGGVTSTISSSVVSVIIAEGAHHLDLRGSNPRDPISVIEARKLERSFIKKWIANTRTERKEKAKKKHGFFGNFVF